jgi:serine/threonine-protein kinase
MGIVVAATHLQLEQPIAIKFLQPDALASSEVVAPFVGEARAAMRIKSELVARVLDVGALESGDPSIRRLATRTARGPHSRRRGATSANSG